VGEIPERETVEIAGVSMYLLHILKTAIDPKLQESELSLADILINC